MTVKSRVEAGGAWGGDEKGGHRKREERSGITSDRRHAEPPRLAGIPRQAHGPRELDRLTITLHCHNMSYSLITL